MILKPKENPQRKAVIYTRVSTKAQIKKGHGLASQETRCREFAKMKGYEVAEVFTERAVTGGVMERPQMSAMLSYLAKKVKTHHTWC